MKMDKHTRYNLLDTVMADASLIERLSQSQSVSLTLTLELDSVGRPVVEHGDLAFGNLSAGNANDLNLSTTRDEGFVPSRPIAGPGEKANAHTEYRLVGKLGSGGTGIVYQAHQRAIDREVAVKVLRDELANDTLSRRRFLQEARTLGSLDHPNVIALHELGTGPQGELFYSMKRIDGTSWDRTIDSMSFSENIDTLIRVADAIRYAHSRGLIHRDIKPENVMIGRFGEVLVADWGLALSFDGNLRMVVSSKSIGGTPAYMAPELAAGEADTQTIRTDVYLLGAVLYRILTGHAPHGGNTLLECIQAAAANEILPTRLTDGWINIAMHAMATHPQDRYQDAEAFLQAIEQQKLHQQSEDLLRRARRRMEKQLGEITHQDYNIAEGLVREAIDLWPENQEASQTLAKLQTEHARAAAAHGDYDLALLLLNEVGMDQSELASRVRRDQQHRKEQATREAKFSALFPRSPDAGLLSRLDNAEIIEANEQFERMTGYLARDVVHQKIPDIRLWACQKRRSEFIRVLSEKGRVEDFETPVLRQDGTTIEAALSANSVTMDGVHYILTTIRDIGARKDAQSQLKKSQNRLRELQRLAQLGTWEYDVRTGEVRWSDEAFRIAGRSVEHGAPNLEEYLSMVHPEDREKLTETIHNSIAHQAAYELRLRQQRTDGSYCTVIARGQPQMNGDGKVIELYGVVIDITRQTNEIEHLKSLIDDET